MLLQVKMTKADVKALKEDLARQMRMSCGVSVVEGDDVVKITTDFNDKSKVHLEFCSARAVDASHLSKVMDHFGPQFQYLEPGDGVFKICLRSVPQDNLGVELRMQLEVER